MIDVKCKNCSRLLMKATLVVAAIKCPRCGKIFEYKVLSNLSLTNSYDSFRSEAEEPNPITG